MFEAKRAKRLLTEATSLANRISSIEGDRRANVESIQKLAGAASALVRNAQDMKSQAIWSSALSLEAHCVHRLGENDIALVLLFASSSPYWPGQDDSILGRIAVQVSRIYMRLGDSDSAATFAIEAHRRYASDGRSPRFFSWLYGILLAAGAPDPVRRALEMNEYEKLDEPDLSLMRIIAHRLGLKVLDTDSLMRCLAELEYLPSETVNYHRAAVAWSLAHSEDYDTASELLRTNIARLLDEDESAWTIARNRQMLANVRLRAGDWAEASQLAVDAWCVSAAGLASTGSSTLRASIQRSFSMARGTAMRAAVELKDFRLLTELLEYARLQAEPNIQGSGQEMDVALATGRVAPKQSRPGTRIISGADAPEPWSLLVEHTYHGRLDLDPQALISVNGESRLAEATERLRSEALHISLQRPAKRDLSDARRAAGLRPEDSWLHYWVEGSSAFWALSSSILLEGGVNDLDADRDLVGSLNACTAANGLGLLIDTDDQPCDLHSGLEVADSRDELCITRPLAALIPKTLGRQMKDASQDRPITIALSLAPELSAVPWPIVPISSESDAPRLIERCVLHFMPSVITLLRLGRERSEVPSSLPFLLSCDFMGETPDLSLEVVPKLAQIRLGNPVQVQSYPDVELATLEAFVRALRLHPPGSPGLAFFRTHYERVYGDPSSSGLVLHNGRAEGGMLFVMDRDDGSAIAPMPSDVILSCCSSAPTADDNGGETTGIVAGCIRSGALRLIATAVDVAHASFTNAWDDMLIEMMLNQRDHIYALRDLQLSMLSEWRRLSLRREPHLSDRDIRDPLPTIWAYYQAYGFRTTKE